MMSSIKTKKGADPKIDPSAEFYLRSAIGADLVKLFLSDLKRFNGLGIAVKIGVRLITRGHAQLLVDLGQQLPQSAYTFGTAAALGSRHRIERGSHIALSNLQTRQLLANLIDPLRERSLLHSTLVSHLLNAPSLHAILVFLERNTLPSLDDGRVANTSTTGTGSGDNGLSSVVHSLSRKK